MSTIQKIYTNIYAFSPISHRFYVTIFSSFPPLKGGGWGYMSPDPLSLPLIWSQLILISLHRFGGVQ